jgi:hypothetical protein
MWMDGKYVTTKKGRNHTRVNVDGVVHQKRGRQPPPVYNVFPCVLFEWDRRISTDLCLVPWRMTTFTEFCGNDLLIAGILCN